MATKRITEERHKEVNDFYYKFLKQNNIQKQMAHSQEIGKLVSDAYWRLLWLQFYNGLSQADLKYLQNLEKAAKAAYKHLDEKLKKVNKKSLK